MNYGNLLVEHAAVSLVGWLLGTIFGLKVGLRLVRLWGKFNRDDKKSQALNLFVPWRTFIAILLLLNLFPTVPVRLFGIGSIAGILSVAYVVFFLTIVLVCEIMQNQKEPILQISAWMRTLAVLSVVIAVHYGAWGGGGLGFAFRQQVTTLRIDGAWDLLLTFSGSALIIDEGTAVIHWFVYSYVDKMETHVAQKAG